VNRTERRAFWRQAVREGWLKDSFLDGYSPREIEAKRKREIKRLKSHKRFVRFGLYGSASRIGLDPEFMATRGGGLYDPHRAEAATPRVYHERGVSCYFAFPAPDGSGWAMEGPDTSRATYHVRGDYLWNMVTRGLAHTVCRGEVFLLEAELLIEEERVHERDPWGEGYVDLGFDWPTYATGSDGEPLVKNARTVSRLDPWGLEGGVPTLYCCERPYLDPETGELWRKLRPLAEAIRLPPPARFAERFCYEDE